MALWIYRLLFLPAALLAAPFYLLRMRRRGGYARHFSDRFGSFSRVPARTRGKKRVWIQAVSVGEMLALGPLLDRLTATPGIEVVLTTTTSTGYALAEDRYGPKVCLLGYYPLDTWLFSHRAWRFLQPDLVLMMEGEWWAEHFAQARLRRVPIVCVNARLSDRSFRRMKRMRAVVLQLFGHVDQILVASQQDYERFVGLGFDPQRLVVTGNLKLDVGFTPLTADERTQLRPTLGFPNNQRILLGSSTWPGEEAALLAVFQSLRQQSLPVSLLLVPRHAERREEIRALLVRSGFRFHLRSEGPPPSTSIDVLLADTTGELKKLTQLADVVFVGKSLPPHSEGQTPIEAAMAGKPILFGPGMSNFRTIARELVEVGAAQVVASPLELETVATALLLDSNLRETMGRAGLQWFSLNQGALERTIRPIQHVLMRVI